jgi:hypothetical protein
MKVALLEWSLLNSFGRAGQSGLVADFGEMGARSRVIGKQQWSESGI